VSTTRRTPGVFASPTPRNEQGQRLCRNCAGVMPKGKRHNCSAKCTDEWALKTSPNLMRAAVFQRDRGICARCKVDTEARKAEFAARRKSIKGWPDYEKQLKDLRELYGVPPGRAASGPWWDADHILPVIEGGGECGIEGYRTLCILCHRIVTNELRWRMKQARRERKALERDSTGLFAEQLPELSDPQAVKGAKA
jgi:5-methylcytosine-specific restriction protein A